MGNCNYHYWKSIMRVIVCGGRDYKDDKMVRRILFWLRDQTDLEVFELAHGDCLTGADALAQEWNDEYNEETPVAKYPAEWNKHNPRAMAGPIRNGEMLEDFKPDIVAAFPGGRGTADMVRKAQEAGVTVMLVGKNFPL